LVRKQREFKYRLRDCNILTIVKRNGKSRQYLVLEKNEYFWILKDLSSGEKSIKLDTELHGKDLLFSIVKRQELWIWHTAQFKPIRMIAYKFINKSVGDSKRLVFMAVFPDGTKELVDNGRLWQFADYGEPFDFCGYLACSTQLKSGLWTITVDGSQHYRFQSASMPVNLQVVRIGNNAFLTFRHPDYLVGWVTLSLKDYGFKPGPID